MRSVRPWGGYVWFMTLGTTLPLPIFLGGYLAELTFVGGRLAREAYRFGIFMSTLGRRLRGRPARVAAHRAHRATS